MTNHCQFTKKLPMKKNITIIVFSLIIAILAILVIQRTQKNEDLNSLKNNVSITSYIYETETGEVKGTLDDWLNGKYVDYVLDEQKSRCNNGSSGLSWDEQKHTVLLTSKEAGKCTLYFRLDAKNIADLIKGLIKSGNEVVSGNGYLYYHNSSLTNGAADSGYRYAGSQPNNYICFGNGSEGYNNGTSATCPTTNKYRIIGLVPVKVGNQTQNLVKIIKAEYITATELGISSTGTVTSNSSYTGLKRIEAAANKLSGFPWNTTYVNTWNGSSLYNALNGTYLTNLGNWKEKIEKVKWNVGGWNANKIIPKDMYNAEMTNSGSTGAGTIVEAKVGLMYAHDYGFASKKNNWTSHLYDYDNNGNSNRENNWLYNGVYEWTISLRSSTSSNAFDISDTGRIFNSSVGSFSGGVRPVLYLKSDVKVKQSDADGSISKPYKIA